MKVIFVSFSDRLGGASIATKRFFEGVSLCSRDIDMSWIVAQKIGNDPFVKTNTKLESALHFCLRVMVLLMSKLQLSRNKHKHSLNIFSMPGLNRLVGRGGDIIHLHWINNETVSLRRLRQLSRLASKVVITLHDEWWLGGSEHFPDPVRVQDGYLRHNHRGGGVDFDRWGFREKVHLMKTINPNVVFTVPSSQMYNAVKASKLLSGSRVSLIPNVLGADLLEVSPDKQTLDFIKANISKQDFVLCFGAIGGLGNNLKGGQMLKSALDALAAQKPQEIVLLTFGAGKKGKTQVGGYQVLNLGYLDHVSKVKAVLSQALVTVVPSYYESFGQVAAESLVAGTPVIAYKKTGVVDIVEHKKTGFLFDDYSEMALISCLEEAMNLGSCGLEKMGEYGRNEVVRKFSSENISKQLLDLYADIL